MSACELKPVASYLGLIPREYPVESSSRVPAVVHHGGQTEELIGRSSPDAESGGPGYKNRGRGLGRIDGWRAQRPLASIGGAAATAALCATHHCKYLPQPDSPREFPSLPAASRLGFSATLTTTQCFPALKRTGVVVSFGFIERTDASVGPCRHSCRRPPSKWA